MKDSELRRFRAGHLGRLFAELHRDFSIRSKQLLASRKHPGIRPAHTQVFASLPLDGARLTTLAERAGITKQSMASLVAELEKLGYLERMPDPSDARATWIRFSTKGMRMLADASETTAEVKRFYAQKIGKKRVDELERTLADLVAALDIDVPV